MGHAIENMCKDSQTCEIVAGVDTNLGVPHPFPTAPSLLELNANADVIIDFSHHSACKQICDYATETGTPVVFATTGYSEDELDIIKKTSKKIAIFRSGNMSVGINLLIELSKKAAKALGDFDAEIIEQHHNQKLDAPSGTALMIADALASIKPDSQYIYDRSQVRRKRQANEIGIHSIRAGSIVGEHEVIFAGSNEIVKLSHSASSREVFADGALKAACFIKDQKPGLYDMSKMLQNII